CGGEEDRRGGGGGDRFHGTLPFGKRRAGRGPYQTSDRAPTRRSPRRSAPREAATDERGAARCCPHSQEGEFRDAADPQRARADGGLPAPRPADLRASGRGRLSASRAGLPLVGGI